jgi:hypothetical protein
LHVVASRRRSFLFALAVGFSAAVLPGAMAGAQASHLAQDGSGATFGGQSTAVSTTAVGSASTTVATTNATQTVVETPDPPATRLLTESRKVAAVIAGLVIVALALALLTVRYWRQTKPMPLVDADDADADEVEAVDEPLFVAPASLPADPPVPAEPEAVAEELAEPIESIEEPAVSAEPDDATNVESPSGPDHQGVDADWEPRTGEHPVVTRPAAMSLARPTAAVRRKALGVPDGS